MNRFIKSLVATLVATHIHTSSSEIIGRGPVCKDYDGVLRFRSGDPASDAASVFFMYTINQLIYAEMHNLLPWIHFDYYGIVYDPAYHPFSLTSIKMMGGGHIPPNLDDPAYPYPGDPVFDPSKMHENTFLIKGNGIWNHYFQPINNFHGGDPSCVSKPYLLLDYRQILPGLKYNTPWAVRAYQFSNHGIRNWQKTNPKFGPSKGQSLHNWYGEMRVRAAAMVKKHYKLQPWLQEKVDKANPITPNDSPCLALQIRRKSNEGKNLEAMMIHDFTPYVQTYVEEGGKIIYISTDQDDVFQYIEKDWPASITSLIRKQSNPLKNDNPDFEIDDNHTTNTKILTDIYAMSKCELLIHGFSPMAEAAIYLNIGLHEHSINLEDPDHKNVDTFRTMVKLVQEKAESKKVLRGL